MSDKLVERIQEEIKKLQDQRAEWDKTIGHYQLQIDNLTKQYVFLGILESSLKSLLAPTVGEVVGAGAGKSSVPPITDAEAVKSLSSAIKVVLAGKLGVSIKSIASRVKQIGYKTKSKNFEAIISQCLGEPKNRNTFKRIGRGIYALKGKA